MHLSFLSTNRRNQHRLGFLGLLAVVLILGACGTSSASESTLVTNEPLVAPTAVPTTAPLSLPAEDTTLPALAPLPAAITVAPVATTAPSQAATAPTETASTEVVATETEPVASQAVASAVEVPVANEAVTVVSVSQWSDCMVEAAQRVGAIDLLDPIAAGTTVDLSSVQLNSLASASVGCDVVATSLASTDLVDHIPTAATCLNAWLESSGGGSVLTGLESVARGQVTPAWAQPHLLDALDSCFTGASFAADVMADVAANSSLNGAFDSTCLATSFDASGTLRGYAQRLAADPTSATLYVTLSDSWVLSCANVGQMVAAAAAADGVALSPSSVSCIDAELKTSGLVPQLVAGTADPDVVGIATLACLTTTESAALFG